MISLEHAEVSWDLNSHCQFKCSYCRPEWKNGGIDRSIEQYLSIVDKLQTTRYQHHNKIYWEIGGGEPLHFPHLSTLLKKIKEKPSSVQLNTSGDDNWFSLYGVLNFVDKIKFTYHPWQNDDVADFIFEQCKEKNIDVIVVVPLVPGGIVEARAKVEYFKSLGHKCKEQILHDAGGKLYHGYSQVDENRIYGKPDDYVPTVILHDPNKPDPNYIDLTIVNNTDPVYTGLPCYAGVDWLHINHKGFVSYSQCRGRNESLNAFDLEWQPPSDHFPCTVNQCRSEQDRTKIRIKSQP